MFSLLRASSSLYRPALHAATSHLPRRGANGAALLLSAKPRASICIRATMRPYYGQPYWNRRPISANSASINGRLSALKRGRVPAGGRILISRRGLSDEIERMRSQMSKMKIPPHEMPVWIIIGINATVFVLWQLAHFSLPAIQFMLRHFTVSFVGVVEHFRLHTLLTSTASHMSLSHFAFNNITLYFFGTTCLAVLGPAGFLQLYVAGGVFSSLCCIVWSYVAPKLDIPAAQHLDKRTPSLGASGAINAVVAWYICRFPTAMLYIYAVLPIPAALAGVLFILQDLRGLYKGGTQVANAGHIGGAVVGVAYWAMGGWRLPRLF